MLNSDWDDNDDGKEVEELEETVLEKKNDECEL